MFGVKSRLMRTCSMRRDAIDVGLKTPDKPPNEVSKLNCWNLASSSSRVAAKLGKISEHMKVVVRNLWMSENVEDPKFCRPE